MLDNIDWALTAQAVTAVVAAGFALIKAIAGLVKILTPKREA